MAKAKGGGKLHPLPFTTFGEIAALGLKATVYCSACYEHRPLDPAAEQIRDRCFATTRFRCTEIRYTGNVCGSLGAVEIEPSLLLPVGGNDHLAFLSCRTCLPSWSINYIPIEQPPWNVVDWRAGDHFRCPGCRRLLSWHIHGPTWRPIGSTARRERGTDGPERHDAGRDERSDDVDAQQ